MQNEKAEIVDNITKLDAKEEDATQIVASDLEQNDNLRPELVPLIHHSKNLTYRDIIKKTLVSGAYITGFGFVASLGSFANSVMQADLGTDALAASGLTATTQLFTIVVFTSLLNAISPMVSQYNSAGNYEDVGSTFQQGVLLGSIVSIPLSIILWEAGAILQSFGTSQDLVSLVDSYFHSYTWGLLPWMILLVSMQFTIGTQRLKLAIIQETIDAIGLNLIGYLLAFGKVGLTAMGMAGFGAGFSIQRWLSCICWLLYFRFRSEFSPYQLFNLRIKSTFNFLKKILTVGIPICLESIGVFSGIYFSTIMVNWLGEDELAANQIVQQYIMLLYTVPAFSLATTSAILVGEAVGQKNYQNMQRYATISTVIGIIYSSLMLSILSIFPKQLSGVFIDVNDPNNYGIISLVTSLYIILGIGQIFDSIGSTNSGAMRGVLETKIPMFINLLLTWAISMPFAYFLSQETSLGVNGVAVSNSLTAFMRAILMFSFWQLACKQMISHGKVTFFEKALQYFTHCNITPNSPCTAIKSTFKNCYSGFFSRRTNSIVLDASEDTEIIQNANSKTYNFKNCVLV